MSVDAKVSEIRQYCTQSDNQLRTDWIAAHPLSCSRQTEDSISPNIITYLRDTFDAMDTDRNGSLDSMEFWNILVSVLQLTEGDEQILAVDYPYSVLYSP